MPITQSDVARAARVSTATVSLALAGHPRISASTRARIVALAEELGYRPDPLRSELARSRWRHRSRAGIAFLTEPGVPIGRRLELLTDESRRRGYDLSHYRVERSTIATVCRQLLERGVRGMLIGSLRRGDWLESVPFGEFSAIAVGLGPVRPPLHVVKTDNVGNLLLARAELWARGHRRVGCALGADMESLNGILTVGTACACHQRGEDVPPLLLPLAAKSEWSHRVRMWIRRERPDAVIVGLRLSAERLRQLLPAARRIVVADLDLGARSRGDGVRPDDEALCTTVLDLLVGALRDHQRGLPLRPRTVLVPGCWRSDPSA